MIEEIATEYEIPVEDLQKIEEGLKKAYNNMPNIPILKGKGEEDFIRKGLILHAKRIKKANAEQMFGIILTFSQPKSSTKRRIEDAIIKYKQNPEKAIQEGYVAEYKNGMNNQFMLRKLNKQGLVTTKMEMKVSAGAINTGDTYILPLDNNKFFKSGKANFKYLNPLSTDAYFCNIGGILTVDGESYHNFSLSINLDNPDFKVPMNKPIKFRAEVLEIKDGSYNLKFKKDITKFQEIEGDISALQEQIIGYRQIVDILSIPEIHTGQFGTPTAIVGTVTEIWINRPTDDKPNSFNTLVIEDLSCDNPIRIQCHQAIPLDFGQGSVILIWGNTSKGKKWDKETRQSTTEDEYSLWAEGIYPLVKMGPEERPEEITANNVRPTEPDTWE